MFKIVNNTLTELQRSSQSSDSFNSSELDGDGDNFGAIAKRCKMEIERVNREHTKKGMDGQNIICIGIYLASKVKQMYKLYWDWEIKCCVT